MTNIHLFSVERPMNPLRSSLVCALALASFGCHPESVTNVPVTPTAGIHFVNAVPDTMQLDFRVVDMISNAGLFDADFRIYDMFYKGIEAGNREIKIFLSSTNPSITSQFITDTTFSFAQDLNYTFINLGFSRTGQTPARTVVITQDAPPTPVGNQLGLRFIHAGAGLGGVDLYVLRHATDTLTLPTATATNVTFGTVRVYGLIPSDTVTADSLRIAVYATGTTTGPLALLKAPTGTAGSPTVNPIPGSRVAGTVFTAILVPRSVAGSMAPQTAAFTTPTLLYLVDKRPPNTAP